MKNLMMLILIFSFFLIVGCDKKFDIEYYKCSAEEMAKVEKETEFCKKNTSFKDYYCYSAAIQRNCTFKINHQQKENENVWIW